MYESAFYDEAARRYAQRVRARAVAVYRLDTPHAHVDLLAVVDRPGLDNRYFYSPWERLTQPWAAAFAREPFILPAFSLRAMRHAACERRTLLAGRDILLPYVARVDEDERICREIEERCVQVSSDSPELLLLQAALRGETSYDRLDRQYAYRRSLEIQEYRRALAALGFPYGDLFPSAAHPGSITLAPAPRMVEQLVHNLYTLRRRIESYA